MNLGSIQEPAVLTKKPVSKACDLASLGRHRCFHLHAPHKETLCEIADVFGLGDFLLNDQVKRLLQTRRWDGRCLDLRHSHGHFGRRDYGRVNFYVFDQT